MYISKILNSEKVTNKKPGSHGLTLAWLVRLVRLDLRELIVCVSVGGLDSRTSSESMTIFGVCGGTKVRISNLR